MEKTQLQQEHLLMRNYSKPCNSTRYLSAYFYTTSYFTGLWFLAKCIESGSIAAALKHVIGSVRDYILLGRSFLGGRHGAAHKYLGLGLLLSHLL